MYKDLQWIKKMPSFSVEGLIIPTIITILTRARVGF